MGFLFIWIIMCAIIGAIASDKVIGFWGGFLWSFFLSPLIGLIIALLSQTKTEQLIQQGMKTIISQNNQPNQTTPSKSPSEQLKELEELKTKNLISEEEYTTLRSKIMAKMMSS